MTSVVAASEHIYHKLKEDITCGEIALGERLITERVAEKYNVSRTPVREAIKKLENDGLVVTYRNSGAVIAKKTFKYISDVYAVRTELECLAIRNAIERHPSVEELNELKKCCEAVTHTETLGEQEKADFNFHMAICRISQMEPVIDIMEKHLILLSSFKLSPHGVASRSFQRDDVGREEHRLLTKAIIEGKVDTAVSLVRKHLSSAIDYVLECKKKQMK